MSFYDDDDDADDYITFTSLKYALGVYFCYDYCLLYLNPQLEVISLAQCTHTTDKF